MVGWSMFLWLNKQEFYILIFLKLKIKIISFKIKLKKILKVYVEFK